MTQKLNLIIKRTATILILSLTLSLQLQQNFIIDNYDKIICFKEIPDLDMSSNNN